MIPSAFELLDVVYEAIELPDRWPKVLELMTEAMGASSAFFGGGVARGGRIVGPSFAHSQNMNEPEALRYCLERRVLTNTTGRASGDHLEILGDALEPTNIIRVELVEPLLSDVSICRPIESGTSLTPSLLVLLVIFHRRAQSGFTEHQRTLLGQMLPHLQRALRLHVAIEIAEAELRTALATLDLLETGFLLWSERSGLLHQNPAAQEILSDGQLLCLEDGRLRAPSQGATERLAALIEGACRSSQERTSSIRVHRDDGAESLMVTVVPLGATQPAARGCAAILIKTSGGPPTPTKEVLRALFELTPTEATVARGIAGGSELSAVAGDLDISMNTARTHLKRVFQKTGTHRQAELVRLVFRGVPAVRWEGRPS